MTEPNASSAPLTPAQRADRPLTVVIAACTRRRPRMLERLLESYTALEVPEAVTPVFLVVENDTEASSTAVIDAFQDRLPGPLHAALETVPGIPMARNRGLHEAAALGADLTLYVDDDETVAPDWLVALVAAWRGGSAELIGGPVRLTPPEEQLTGPQRSVYDGMVKRFASKEKRAVDRMTNGQVERVTVVTNNWLCDMRLYHDLGLRFDEALQFTGGSDTRFFRAARELGVETGWAPEAIVYETVPPERLTLPYQFARGRDQSATSFGQKIAEGKWGDAVISILILVPLKTLSLGLILLSLPVSRNQGLVALFRQSGWIVGRFSRLFGGRSKLYKKTTGS
ncbi:glycosyltransferase family 2 protein [Dinoroseobacter sp. S375]|uniref:glycosyltransferase family 2 protein n=1 Tax=Dinoroseobacter sp. S375 TaxID=3415136 RepID=UPI003C7DA39C